MDEPVMDTCFLHCMRCLGHGHLVTPLDGIHFEVFSQFGAYLQLGALAEKGRISEDDLDLLADQIIRSGLPKTCPPDVETFIRSFCTAEAWVEHHSRGKESRPLEDCLDSDELAWAVHEFLLCSPDHTLRLQ